MTGIVLPGLARGLLQERNLRLRPGPWALALVRPPELRVDPRVLAAGNPCDADLGCLAHECAHFWISRYALFEPRDLPAVVWATAMNAIEDPRANLFVQRRLPGTGRWIAAMHARDRASPRPPMRSRLHAFLAACSVADAYGYEAPDWLLEGPHEALLGYCETTEARLAYATTLPPDDLWLPVDTRELERLLHCEAELDPAALVRLSPSGAEWEPHVTLVAARAYAIAERHILPVVRRLLDADVEEARRRQQTPPAGEDSEEPRVRVEDLLDAGGRRPPSGTDEGGEDRLSSMLSGRDTTTSPWSWMADAQEAWRAFLDLLEALLEGRPPPRSVAVRLSAGEKTVDESGESGIRPHSGRADVPELRRSMARHVAPLLSALRSRIRPTRRLRTGFASGRRVDLGRLMAFEATGRGGDALWMRFVPGQNRQAAVHLLVDLSGSMRGSEIAAATAATVLFAETLARLGDEVEWAIDGFQDELVPVKNYAERPGHAVWQRIAELPLEVDGRRPGGHNCPQWNDDGPCLREAGTRLRTRRASSRLLVVLSDGLPCGRRSEARDLHDAVAELVRDPSLDLVGVGVGPGTEHVRDFYPVSLASVPLDELATRLAGLLERHLAVR